MLSSDTKQETKSIGGNGNREKRWDSNTEECK